MLIDFLLFFMVFILNVLYFDYLTFTGFGNFHEAINNLISGSV